MPVIKMEFARAGLAAGATSETFLNQMQVLRDARAWAGGMAGAELPRFSDSTLRYLERALLARGADLRDAVFQLSHLLALAAAADPRGRALDTLYGFAGPVRAGALAAHLAAAAARAEAPAVALEDRGFVLRYAGGEGYRLAHARLPLLVALLEFLLTTPDAPGEGREVMSLIARIEAAPGGFETVRAASNAIAAALNATLDRVMRSRVERDRIEALTAHLDATAEDHGAGDRRWVIDDAAILSFWLRGAEEPGRTEDFRQFRTVHRAFVALVLALREGEDFQRLYRPQTADDEEGLLQIAADQGSFETIEDGLSSPLDALSEDPVGRVKFLTGAEAKGLEIAARLWGAVRAFPLAVLRSEVMGAAQNEIINALRFGRPLGPLVRLETRADGEEAGYPAVAERYGRLRAHLRLMLHAAAHVMAERRGIRLPEEKAAETRKAFRSVRRAGFAEAFEDATIGAAFEAAITPLGDLAGLLADLSAALPGELGERFEQDRALFADAFTSLYRKET